MPRSVLEAMAVGRPVITTDTIGCRETVINAGRVDAAGIRIGENGLLVPVKSVEPLTQAMLRLARDPEMCVRMGARGRALALERFDVQQINRQMLRAMDLGGSEQSSAQI
jgi:glycosyltransferase involved in cell wall biosynthesis